MFNETEIRPGQVISFDEALPLRAPSGVELGELGVVRSVHQGGMTWDSGRVDLVGGREVSIYQPDLVSPAPAEIGPEAVYQQPARADQRDPYSPSNLPLSNGAILQRGDLVHFPESNAKGSVVDVPRLAENRAWVQMEQSGERVPVYATSDVSILKTAPELAAERAAEQAAAETQQVEQATIREIDKQASRSEPKRAVGNAEIEPAREAEVTRLSGQDVREQGRVADDPATVRVIDRDRNHEPEAEGETGHEAVADHQPAPERLREAAQEAHRAPEPQPEPTAQPQAELAQQQAQQRAMEQSAGRETPGHEAQHSAEPTPTPAYAEGATR
jgi:hypothetical protein